MNTDEMEAFCAAAWPRLVDALTFYCADRFLAEELVQEALLRACERWPRVRRLESPEGWTFRVAVNLANSRWRRRRIERRVQARPDPAAVQHHDPSVVDRLAVRNALEQLSPRAREIVVLRFFLDQPHARIAELVGLSPSGTRTALQRAVVELRRELDLTSGTEPEEVEDVR